MGAANSKSKITKTTNQLIVNRSSVNVVNEQLNDLKTNVAIDMAKSCSNSAAIEQQLKFVGATIEGDVTFSNVSADAEMKVSFNCLQAGEVRNEMGNEMARTLMEAIQTNVDSEVIAQLETEAASSASVGALSTGNANSNTKINETINIEQITETNKNFENIMHNAISNNFSNSEIQECLNAVNIKQGIDMSGARVGGNVTVDDFKMNAVADVYSKCIQNTASASKIIDQIAEDTGVEIVEDIAAKQSLESTTVASSTAEALGLFSSESLGFLLLVLILAAGAYYVFKQE